MAGYWHCLEQETEWWEIYAARSSTWKTDETAHSMAWRSHWGILQNLSWLDGSYRKLSRWALFLIAINLQQCIHGNISLMLSTAVFPSNLSPVDYMSFNQDILSKEAALYDVEVRESKFKGAGLGLFCVKGKNSILWKSNFKLDFNCNFSNFTLSFCCSVCKLDIRSS